VFGRANAIQSVWWNAFLDKRNAKERQRLKVFFPVALKRIKPCGISHLMNSGFRLGEFNIQLFRTLLHTKNGRPYILKFGCQFCGITLVAPFLWRTNYGLLF